MADLFGARIHYIAGRYQIVDANGVALSGIVSSRFDAERMLDKMRREKRQRVRPCMCCGEKFRSEGNHNRLCNICRTRDGENWASLSHRRLRIGAGV